MFQSNGTRARVISPDQVKLTIASIPRGAINNVAIARKAGIAHGTSVESNLFVFRGTNAAATVHPREESSACQENQHSAYNRCRFEVRTFCCPRCRDGAWLNSRGGLGQRLQAKRQIASRLEALRRVLFQAMSNNAVERRWNVASGLAELRHVFLQYRSHGIGGSFAMKCLLAGDHFIKNSTKRENIGAPVCRFSPHLLGRHVPRRSHDQTRFGHGLQSRRIGIINRCWDGRQFRQSKVEDFYSSVLSKK